MMSIYVVAGKVCACQVIHAKTQSRDWSRSVTIVFITN